MSDERLKLSFHNVDGARIHVGLTAADDGPNSSLRVTTDATSMLQLCRSLARYAQPPSRRREAGAVHAGQLTGGGEPPWVLAVQGYVQVNGLLTRVALGWQWTTNYGCVGDAAGAATRALEAVGFQYRDDGFFYRPNVVNQVRQVRVWAPAAPEWAFLQPHTLDAEASPSEVRAQVAKIAPALWYALDPEPDAVKAEAQQRAADAVAGKEPEARSTAADWDGREFFQRAWRAWNVKAAPPSSPTFEELLHSPDTRYVAMLGNAELRRGDDFSKIVDVAVAAWTGYGHCIRIDALLGDRRRVVFRIPEDFERGAPSPPACAREHESS